MGKTRSTAALTSDSPPGFDSSNPVVALLLVVLMFAPLGTGSNAGTAAELADAFKVTDPLKEKWWTDEEAAAFFTNRYMVDPRLAAALQRQAAHLGTDDRRRSDQAVQHLTNDPPYLLLADLDTLMRATNAELVAIVRQLSGHRSVAIRFTALVGLAAGGDRAAAEALLALSRS